jgi:hypothetical protein
MKDGPSDLEQDIANLNNKLTIESYTKDDPNVSKVTKDVAILRYKCDRQRCDADHGSGSL